MEHETKLEITKFLIVGSLCVAFLLQVGLIPLMRQPSNIELIPMKYNRGLGRDNIDVYYNDELFLSNNDIIIVLSELEIGNQYTVNITQFDNRSDIFNTYNFLFKARMEYEWVIMFTSFQFNSNSTLRVEVYSMQEGINKLLIGKAEFSGLES